MQVEQSQKDAIMANLAELGGASLRENDVLYQGDKFIIPEVLRDKLGTAISFLQTKEREDEAETSFSRQFRYRPWDGAVALVNAMERAFGAVIHKRQPGFFGSSPPELRTIPTGVTETEQVPWGPVEVPLLPGLTITPDVMYSDEDGSLFFLYAVGPRKYRDMVEGIFALVEEELKNNSIYRGKAFDGKDMPNFLPLDRVNRNEIFFPVDTQVQLDTNVFAPILYPEKMRQLGLSGKRAVLLEGPYGTGKTSVAFIVAQEAVSNGRTFIYARPGKDNLEEVFRTARLYQPAVVFCEDMEKEADITDMDSVSQLLDMFDGFDAKGNEILAILTTNHKEKIVKGMVRPGRLDAIVHLGLPDAHGIEQIVRLNVPGEVLNGIAWDQVASAMEGYLPAFIAEAAQRAVRYSVVRNEGDIGQNITTEDLVDSANGLREQYDLMQDAPEHTPADSLGIAAEKIVEGVLNRSATVHGPIEVAE